MGFIRTSPVRCSLLHCSLMDLTLANSLSVIYDQTAPEPGIYYPLLLSIRQHYITLHCSSQFAEQHYTARGKYAVKSGLTHAEHQVALQFLKRFFFISPPTFPSLFLAVLKGLLIYISGFHILLCHYSLLFLKDVSDYMLQRKSFVSLK